MRYRGDIDGLRALAVVPVILFHAGFTAFSGGFVGVDVFFVISGYLITTLLLNDFQAGTFSLAYFYERRARRILPALFLVIFACLPFAWLWLLPQDMKSFSQSLIAVSLFASNIFFWRTSGYFDAATEFKPLIHTWSLSVEEQFYVIFPLILWLAWKLGRRWLCWWLAGLALISLALAQWLVGREPAFAFYMLPTRAWELLIGALAALYLVKYPSKKHAHWPDHVGSLSGLGLIIYAMLTFTKETPFPGLYALLPTVGTALIIVFANPHTLVSKLLSTKPFIGVGLISYSAYLWHQPLFAFARQRSIEEPSTLLMASLAIIAFPLAFLSWRFVERPFRNKHRFTKKFITLNAAVITGVLIIIGTLGYTTQGFSNRSMAKAFEALSYNTDALGYLDCKQSFERQHGIRIEYCHTTAKGPINAVIIGDSHADDKFFGIEKNDPNHRWGFIGNTSCPPILDIAVEADQKNCQEKFAHIIDHVANDNAIKIVALSFYGNYFLDTDFAADHIRKHVGPSTVKISSEQLPGASREEIFFFMALSRP
jgi:peptidoglycan/LPS O-acetylase OafA/YrhL